MIQLDLQHEACTISTVRDKFDVLIGHDPEMEPRMKPDMRIVQGPDFEQTIIAIQFGEESQLSSTQLASVASLRQSTEPLQEEENETLMHSARKRHKLRATPTFKNYKDTRFLMDETLDQLTSV